MSLSDQKILGLTVRSPWAELIARGVKTVENRSWPPYDFMLGRHLAIHASASWDQQGYDFIDHARGRFGMDPPERAECRYGVIAVVRLVGWVQRTESGPPKTVKMLKGHAFGAAEDQLGHSIDWRWFHGAEYGWVLREVVRIEPVACAGRQKVWQLPRFVIASVRARYGKATAGTPTPAPGSELGRGSGVAKQS